MKREVRPTFDPSTFYSQTRAQRARWSAFAVEIESLGDEIRKSSDLSDFQQLQKFARWGRFLTLVGYAMSWIGPNPVSAIAMGLGNFARWSLVFHQVSHGAFDRIPGVPSRYTSRRFAVGPRRWIDWFDWIAPDNWSVEHNQLHHHHLGSTSDPDVIWRNTKVLRQIRVPAAVRYGLALLTAAIWKPAYYAPNTLIEARYFRGQSASNKISWATWNPIAREGRELWTRCLLPYAVVKFVAIPLAFFPLGKMAMIWVLINSIAAEILANLYSFALIGPSHTGDDVLTFGDSSKGKSDYYLRQILGTVNYPAGTDLTDFLYGGMNYQIEHHLWPNATLQQCRKIRPKLRELCRKHGVPYSESPLWPRLLITMRMMAGTCEIVEVAADSNTGQARKATTL